MTGTRRPAEAPLSVAGSRQSQPWAHDSTGTRLQGFPGPARPGQGLPLPSPERKRTDPLGVLPEASVWNAASGRGAGNSCCFSALTYRHRNESRFSGPLWEPLRGTGTGVCMAGAAPDPRGTGQEGGSSRFCAVTLPPRRAPGLNRDTTRGSSAHPAFPQGEATRQPPRPPQPRAPRPGSTPGSGRLQ